MERKTFDLIEAKADDEGRFTALASVFGNVDHVGDRMLPGSFSKTLDTWRESGDPIPVILSHQWEDPFAMIGKADPRAVYEDDRGLVVQGTLDLENEVARQVHKLMRDRLLKGWSFGYTVPEGGQKRRKDANEISEVELVEVGPTLKGANPEAQLESIKSAIHGQISVPKAVALGSVKQLDSELRERLTDAGRERFGGDSETYVYADDFDVDASWVVYSISSGSDSRHVRVGYSRSDEGVALASGETEVERSVTYNPKGEEAPPETPPEPDPAPKGEGPPFPASELFGASEGLLKAAWTSAHVDELPDHAFLYVDEGGVPDWKGRTVPRSLRRFPYRDAEGKLDADHLRVAQALIPETDLPKSVKGDLTQRVGNLLDEVKHSPAIEGAAPVKVRARDTLRRSSLDVALEIQSDGQSKTQPPPPPAEPDPEPPKDGELRRNSRAAIMSVLTD